MKLEENNQFDEIGEKNNSMKSVEKINSMKSVEKYLIDNIRRIVFVR